MQKGKSVMRYPEYNLAMNNTFSRIKKSDLFPFIKKIIIYGSCARDEIRNEDNYFGSRSDIDLFFVLDDSINITNRMILDLRTEIAVDEDTYMEIDSRFTIGDNWETSKSIYFDEIRKDGIILWERNV